MKTMVMLTAVALLFPLSLPAAENDQNVGTCFAYMMQNQNSDGARAVARMTTDLEAAQHYVMSALRTKVDTADGVAACRKLGIEPRRYRIINPPVITTQKEERNESGR